MKKLILVLLFIILKEKKKLFRLAIGKIDEHLYLNVKTRIFIFFPKLKKDLTLIQNPIRLQSSKDIAKILNLTQDRKCCRGVASLIKKAVEVSQMKN